MIEDNIIVLKVAYLPDSALKAMVNKQCILTFKLTVL